MTKNQNNQSFKSSPTQQKSPDVSSILTESKPQTSPNVSNIPPTPKKNVPKNRILIGLVFLIIVSTIIGLYLYLQKQGLYSSIQESPQNPQESPSPTPTISGWETYTNAKYTFEVKHPPNFEVKETEGNEDVGQFTYLYKVDFGTLTTDDTSGFIVEINQKKTAEIYRLELVGHITDTINSETKVESNDIAWTKFNYDLFLSPETLSATLAFSDNETFGYAITAASEDIDGILSVFKITKENSIYACPASGWINCQPILSQEAAKACTQKAITWYEESCPNFQGVAY